MTSGFLTSTVAIVFCFFFLPKEKTDQPVLSSCQTHVDTTSSFRSSTFQLKRNHIPDSIFEMINLRYLSVQGMDCDSGDTSNCWDLAEIPQQIRNLKKLETLQLNVNAISAVPPEITELKYLKTLDLTDNPGLSELDNVVKLENLEVLSLNGCNILKLPAEIGMLKKLKSLGLVGNNIDSREKDRIRKALPNCIIYFDN